MAYPTGGPEARMEKFLRDEDSSILFISALGSLRGIRGLSQSRLSAVLRGRGLEHDPYLGLNKLMTELEHLRDAVRPIPVRFHHAGVINNLLDLIERKKLLIVCDVDDESQIAPSSETVPAAK